MLAHLLLHLTTGFGNDAARHWRGIGGRLVLANGNIGHDIALGLILGIAENQVGRQRNSGGYGEPDQPAFSFGSQIGVAVLAANRGGFDALRAKRAELV